MSGPEPAWHRLSRWVGWSFVRDPSGFLIARYRKCLPIAVGTLSDRVFGMTAVPHRARRPAAEERDDG